MAGSLDVASSVSFGICEFPVGCVLGVFYEKAEPING